MHSGAGACAGFGSSLADVVATAHAACKAADFARLFERDTRYGKRSEPRNSEQAWYYSQITVDKSGIDSRITFVRKQNG
jgi:hypothetical protein